LGKQANVNFASVNRHADVTVPWDLLPKPNGNGVMDDFSTYGNQAGDLTERNAIINTTTIPDLDPSPTITTPFISSNSARHAEKRVSRGMLAPLSLDRRIIQIGFPFFLGLQLEVSKRP
jgi:hypothetical protein